MVKNPPTSEGAAGDIGSVAAWGRSPGEDCLGNAIDREAWHAASPWGPKESDMTEWLK